MVGYRLVGQREIVGESTGGKWRVGSVLECVGVVYSVVGVSWMVVGGVVAATQRRCRLRTEGGDLEIGGEEGGGSVDLWGRRYDDCVSWGGTRKACLCTVYLVWGVSTEESWWIVSVG